MGLRDQYTAVRGQLLMMRPTPTLNHAFSLLLQEESQREFASNLPPVTDNMAMNVRFNNRPKVPNPTGNMPRRVSNDPNLQCEFCQNTGHLKDKCFYLHGYPEWHKLYGKPKPKLKKVMNPSFKAAAKISVKGAASGNLSPTDNIKDNNFNLSEAQCQQIVRMLQDKMTSSASWNTSPSTSQLSGISELNFLHSEFSSSTVVVNTIHFLNKSNPNLWILDFGATNHITFQSHLLHDIKPLNSVLHLPNGEKEIITHVGNIRLSPHLTLYEVLCVPTFHCNLISIAKLTAHSSCVVSFSNSKCMIHDLTLMKEREISDCHEGLYKFHPTCFKLNSASTPISNNFVPSKSVTDSVYLVTSNAFCNKSDTISLWHLRMGHPSVTVLQKLNFIRGSSEFHPACDICHFSKQHRLTFTDSTSYSSNNFDLIHIDVWGPYKQITHNKCSYFLTIVDDHSRATWVFLFAHKTQVPNLIKHFISYVQNQFQTTVKIIRTDNGSEFINFDVTSYMSSVGIVHQTSCPHTPQQNGRV